MHEWWIESDGMMQVLLLFSCGATFIFIVQMLLTFIGVHFDTSTDVDINTDTMDGNFPFHLLTFRNFVNFSMGFGWTAVVLHWNGVNSVFLVIISTLAGVALVAAVMYLFCLMGRMEQSGNINIESAIGCTGNVYLTIPRGREHIGMVQITINDSIREFDAVTDGEGICNGAPIEVVGFLNDRTLIVKAL